MRLNSAILASVHGNGDRNGENVRAGAHILTLLGSVQVPSILHSLEKGPKTLRELRRDTGLPAQSTLRTRLLSLEAVSAVSRHERNFTPGALEYELAGPGYELLVVATGMERWLAECPDGPLKPDGSPARAAIKGLIDSWSTTVLTMLATEPLSLTDLDKRIGAVSYPTIERCLETMRLAGQLLIGFRDRRGTPYEPTTWLRRGLAVLILAAWWEHRNRPEGVDPIRRTDIAGAFALAGPLVESRLQTSGLCQFAARRTGGERKERFLGVVEVRDGEIAFGDPYPPRKPDAWAAATIDVWFAALIEANTRGLRLSGDRRIPLAILDGMHGALFGKGVGKIEATEG